jgi:hypothetical protein
MPVDKAHLPAVHRTFRNGALDGRKKVVGVSTQRRAWMVRAAVVAVTAAVSLVGVAAPAFAADPQLTDISLDPGTISPGQQTSVRFTVSNPDPTPRTISVQVASNNGKVTCGGTCSFTNVAFGPNASKNYNIQFNASGQFSGDEQATLTISAKDGGAGPEVQQQLSIDAPDQSQQVVPEVTGVVGDAATGKPIPAAKVFLQDSQTQEPREVGTDKDGKFKFTSRPDAPIAPGTIALRVEKEGYQPYDRVVQGQAGVPLRVPKLSMASTATASATTGVPTATDGVTDDPTLGTIGDENASQNEKESGLSWILIAIGGVLVLLGIGAIVLLLVRRRGDDDEDDDAPTPRRGPPPGRGGPPPRPGQPPRRCWPPPERTTVMRGPGPMGPPVSPGPRGADQTMIARSPLADMPTQMHRPMPDPQHDPYGRQNGAHAAPHYQAGPPPAGYGPPGYGTPPPPAGYPGGAPSYGAPEPQYGQPYGQQPDPQQYGQPYGAQPGYDQGYDPYDQQGRRPPPPPPGDGRRVDWLDD